MLPPLPVGPQRLSRIRRYGMGDASSVVTGAWNSSGANSTLNSVLQGLPPDVTSALNTGSSIVKNGQPAIDLAKTIGSGGVPSPQEVVAGFAAVAGIINPAAGAIVAGAGEAVIGILDAMQAIFSALGLYTVPDRSWSYVGLLRANADYIPYPPNAQTGAKDPLWLTFPDYITLWNFLGAGIQPPSVAAAGHNYQFYNPDASSGTRNAPFITLYLVALLRSKPLDATIFGQFCAGVVSTPCQGKGYTGNVKCSKLVPATVDGSGKACCGWCTDANCGCYFMGAAPAGTLDCGGASPLNDTLDYAGNQSVGRAHFQDYSPSPFEIYFNTLLIQNLEYWANAQPFVPVRALLAACVQAWNQAHSSSSTTCFKPENPDSKAFPDPVTGGGNFGGWTNGQQWGSGVFYKGNTISWVLGPYGGQTDALSIESDQPQICVNTGPALASTASKVATAAIVVPAAAVGTAAVSTLAYSYVTGQALDKVVKSLWSRTKSFVEGFGR